MTSTSDAARTSSPAFTDPTPYASTTSFCTVVDEVLTELERSERTLPEPLTRPMREVA